MLTHSVKAGFIYINGISITVNHCAVGGGFLYAPLNITTVSAILYGFDVLFEPQFLLNI